MCLIVFAWRPEHPQPLVLAANRDEFFARPAAPLAWWRPDAARADGAAVDGDAVDGDVVGVDAADAVLGGRDLQGGGTWCGLTQHGRLAILTNIRRPGALRADAPSRGAIVTRWLGGGPEARDAASFAAQLQRESHSPFNLIAADFGPACRSGEGSGDGSRDGSGDQAAVSPQWFWASSEAPWQPLAAGIHGLSNALLDTPWPKVVALKSALAAALANARSAQSADQLEAPLFCALADRRIPPDAALPSTGVAIERERSLASAFIRMPDAGYGTRCSTLIIGEATPQGLALDIIERSFDAAGRISGERRERIEGWPQPQPADRPSLPAAPFQAGTGV